MRKIIIFTIFLFVTFFYASEPKRKTKLYEYNVEGKKDVFPDYIRSKSTGVNRDGYLTDEQLEEYTKLVEEGSTDEEILYQLGFYYIIHRDTVYCDKAKEYLLIGAKQTSPKCLYLLVTCYLSEDDMTDVESYDILKKLAEEDYRDAKEYIERISKNTKMLERLKRKKTKITLQDQ